LKQVCYEDPTVAEASAIAWALELAKDKNFKDVVIKGDAKVCIDALNGDSANISGMISSMCSNAKVLASSFKSCCFS
jgi:ribonuclease HI